jgi:hypothetical protein
VEDVLGQPRNSQMRSCEAASRSPIYAVIACIIFSTPTIFSTRVKL